MGGWEALYSLNPLIDINVCTIHPRIQSIQKDLLYLAKFYVSVESVFLKKTQDNIYILNMNEEVRKTFSPGPMDSFQSAQKLSTYLVQAKFYPLQRKLCSSKCGK